MIEQRRELDFYLEKFYECENWISCLERFYVNVSNPKIAKQFFKDIKSGIYLDDAKLSEIKGFPFENVLINSFEIGKHVDEYKLPYYCDNLHISENVDLKKIVITNEFEP